MSAIDPMVFERAGPLCSGGGCSQLLQYGQGIVLMGRTRLAWRYGIAPAIVFIAVFSLVMLILGNAGALQYWIRVETN